MIRSQTEFCVQALFIMFINVIESLNLMVVWYFFRKSLLKLAKLKILLFVMKR